MNDDVLRLDLRDSEWPEQPADHDRLIVRAVVFDDGGRLYFMRVERDDMFGRATLIETSGGGVEPGEDLRAALRRELREELGAEVEIVRELAVVSDYYNVIRRHNINHYFLCRALSFGETHMTEDEIVKFRLSRLVMTYGEAMAEYEKRRDTKLGRLLAARETPVLELAHEIMARGGLSGMDIEHHFVEKGEGGPLILLHGNGEDCGYFKYQTDVFAERFHVYAPDTRGHGKTPRGSAPFTIRQFADDLAGFMDAHGIEKAHILGFSDGGNIATAFALKYPDRVDRLILNGANLDPSGVKRSTQLPIELGYRTALKSAEKSESARRHAELLGLMVNEPHVSPAELAAIRSRTLVIAGTNDVIKEEHTRLIAESVPDSKLVFIKGDHFIARRRPEEFNRAVLDFLLS